MNPTTQTRKVCANCGFGPVWTDLEGSQKCMACNCTERTEETPEHRAKWERLLRQCRGGEPYSHLPPIREIQPIKLPLEALGTSPESMEPHEFGFVNPAALYVDILGQVWINAEAFTVRIETDYNCVRIRRAENGGVEVDLPDNFRYTRMRKNPFTASLPVTKVELVDADEDF